MRDDIDALRTMAIDELNIIANLSNEEKGKLNISWYGDMWKQMYLDFHNQNKKDSVLFSPVKYIAIRKETPVQSKAYIEELARAAQNSLLIKL